MAFTAITADASADMPMRDLNQPGADSSTLIAAVTQQCGNMENSKSIVGARNRSR